MFVRCSRFSIFRSSYKVATTHFGSCASYRRLYHTFPAPRMAAVLPYSRPFPSTCSLTLSAIGQDGMGVMECGETGGGTVGVSDSVLVSGDAAALTEGCGSYGAYPISTFDHTTFLQSNTILRWNPKVVLSRLNYKVVQDTSMNIYCT
eukprot:GHVQ01037238.1.p1 GENE.GHVQ01037238.1~~GHVQ01037238.1.p1  ORF type:complete len:148 (-),score=10.13 GHVQ01037238.1:377-820(-)